MVTGLPAICAKPGIDFNVWPSNGRDRPTAIVQSGLPCITLAGCRWRPVRREASDIRWPDNAAERMKKSGPGRNDRELPRTVESD